MFGRKRPVAIGSHVLENRFDVQALATSIRVAPQKLKTIEGYRTVHAIILTPMHQELESVLTKDSTGKVHMLATTGDTVITYSDDTISVLPTATNPRVKRNPANAAERVLFDG